MTGANIVVVTPRPRHVSIIAAGLIMAAAITSFGIEAYEAGARGGLECIAASSAASLAVLGMAAHRAAEARRTWRSVSRRLLALPDLLREGFEAEPGRFTAIALYTGERVKRSYREERRFRPQGDPEPLTLDQLEEWNPRYTLVVSRDEGVIDADAYRLKAGDVTVYITRLHDEIEARATRRRLVVRRNDEYGEAVIEPQGPELSILVSHVGWKTRARLRVEVTTPLEARLASITVKGRALHTRLRLAPRHPIILLYAEGARVADAARILGYPAAPLAYGHGIEARVTLELLSLGVPRDRDSSTIRTHTPR